MATPTSNVTKDFTPRRWNNVYDKGAAIRDALVAAHGYDSSQIEENGRIGLHVQVYYPNDTKRVTVRYGEEGWFLLAGKKRRALTKGKEVQQAVEAIPRLDKNGKPLAPKVKPTAESEKPVKPKTTATTKAAPKAKPVTKTATPKAAPKAPAKKVEAKKVTPVAKSTTAKPVAKTARAKKVTKAAAVAV
jgi:hypothetical protein